MSNPLDPTFDDLLVLKAKVHGAEQGFTDIPGKVLTYNPATQTADVQPLVMVPHNDTLRRVAILQDVQVRWPAGATWSVVGELVAGDFGWLRFAGADISAWKMQGAENDPTAIKRRGSVSDAYFEPGSQPVSTPLAADAYAAGALVVKAAQLLLGDSTATKALALHGDTVDRVPAPAGAMSLWMTQVEIFINGLVALSVSPLSTTFTKVGAVVASATKVKAI